MSDQGLRVGAQRSQQHLLHMVLSKAQQESGSDVNRNLIRTASPHLDADIAGLQGPDVLLSTPTSGRGGLDTEYAGGIEDRYASECLQPKPIIIVQRSDQPARTGVG